MRYKKLYKGTFHLAEFGLNSLGKNALAGNICQCGQKLPVFLGERGHIRNFREGQNLTILKRSAKFAPYIEEKPSSISGRIRGKFCPRLQKGHILPLMWAELTFQSGLAPLAVLTSGGF